MPLPLLLLLLLLTTNRLFANQNLEQTAQKRTARRADDGGANLGRTFEFEVGN